MPEIKGFIFSRHIYRSHQQAVTHYIYSNINNSEISDLFKVFYLVSLPRSCVCITTKRAQTRGSEMRTRSGLIGGGGGRRRF